MEEEEESAGAASSLRFLPKAVIPAGLNPGFIAALLITAALACPPEPGGDTHERESRPTVARKPRATSGATAIKKKSRETLSPPYSFFFSLSSSSPLSLTVF